MKHLKVLILSCCLFTMTALFSGCWNYREIERLAIVSGIAIDKKDDKYEVTYEIVNISSGRDAKVSTRLISTKGNSVFETFQNTAKLLGKNIYLGHTEILIVSTDLAEEGLIPVLDWFSRDNEPRDTLDVMVSREKSAKEILEQKPITMDVLSFELNDIFELESKFSNMVHMEMWQFVQDISSIGISPVLPAVRIKTQDNSPVPDVSGTAIFKKDRLVGFLDIDETKTLLFVKNMVIDGLLVSREYKDSSQTNISFKILKSSTKLKPIYVGGKIAIEIKIDTDVSLEENGGKDNYIVEAGREKLKKDFEAMLETKIKSLVKKVQEQYDSDIFGFGKVIRQDMPGLWRQTEPHWDQTFKNIDIVVRPTINIKNSAMLSRPVKAGD